MRGTDDHGSTRREFLRRTGMAAGALALGRARTAELPFEHLGRLEQVDLVAGAVKAAMADAGIADPGDVHFVQIKCPLLTRDRVASVEVRGRVVYAWLTGGQDTHDYQLRWFVTDTDGNIFPRVGLVLCSRSS